MSMAYRQIHLDFHTGEWIPHVGKDFSKEDFQENLKIGHVNSITLFSKCHHGWTYHPTEQGEMHPQLHMDLLGAQIEACKEIGVKTPVYLSAGFDQRLAIQHPEWIVLYSRDDKPKLPVAGYYSLCFNTPYLDILTAQIVEVVRNYDTDGIFLDIVSPHICYCPACEEILKSRGTSLDDQDAVGELGMETFFRYTQRIREAIDKYKKGLPLFHNGGHIRRGFWEWADQQSHFEMESLPTGGWGYDHFPFSAAYAHTLDKEYLGMTARFHATWADFGTYKHPNALKYETSLSLAMGARCSIGDQLHPSGKMDKATYTLIGQAYEQVEKKEPYCIGKHNVADVAVLSAEAITEHTLKSISMASPLPDIGAGRLLLEGHYLFDVVDIQADFGKYKVIILPDEILCTETLTDKLKNFTENGGKLLATGNSGVNADGNFLFDFGCTYENKSVYDPSYLQPLFNVDYMNDTPLLMRGIGHNIRLSDGVLLGERIDPYFNRSEKHFSSHFHTPYNPDKKSACMTLGRDGIYIAFPIFEDYAKVGHFAVRKIFEYAMDTLLGNKKTLNTDIPSKGVVTLTANDDNTRFINHLLYAIPTRRGQNTDIIEDLPPIFQVNISLLMPNPPKAVRLAPQDAALVYSYSDGVLKYKADVTDGHQMIEILL